VTLVVDASVALKWFIEEDGSEPTARLLTGHNAPIAPDLIIAEVCNAGWKAVRAGSMTPMQHNHATARMALAFDELVPLAGLAPSAVALSRLLNHPVYDCFYLVLARERDAQMVTADRRLIRQLNGTPWASCTVELC
jgi:predicted nucleic acid-binding protein